MNIRLPTPEEIHVAFTQGEAAIVELIWSLGTQLEELAGQLETQAVALIVFLIVIPTWHFK